MIVSLDKKIHFINRTPFEIQLTEDVREKVEKYWEEFIKGKIGYWDGDIITVTNIDEDYNIEIGKTKYSNLIYAKYHQDLVERALFTAILFKTKDNKYLIIKNYHEMYNIIGGIADLADFKDGVFSMDSCLKREVLEEIGLDIDNPKEVVDYNLKYLKIPPNNENYYPIGTLYTGNLNFTSKELKEFLSNNKFDDEIKEVYFFDAKECQNLQITDIDGQYIKDFVKMEEDCSN